MSGAGALREKDTLYGFWCVTGHPAVVDAAASVGPDFIVIDTQHGVDLGGVDAALFTVMAHYGVPGLVRVPSTDATPIGRALDLGADGIIVPLVETRADAEEAVAATKYSPGGKRSYGMQTRRIGPFDQRPFVAIQIETAGAMDNIAAIADVEHVDALYIGPADLALSLGGPPAVDVNEVFDGTHSNAKRLDEAFAAVVAACHDHAIIPGIHVGNGATARRAAGQGFRMSAVTSDLGLTASGLSTELAVAREY